jgi:hypothetical protein
MHFVAHTRKVQGLFRQIYGESPIHKDGKSFIDKNRRRQYFFGGCSGFMDVTSHFLAVPAEFRKFVVRN